MPIQKTIRTPLLIQIFFWMWMIVPILIITTIYSVIDANATPTARECRTAWEDGFFKEIQPSPCTRYFPMFTKQEIARFNKYHLTK
jgi:hypothetical protein